MDKKKALGQRIRLIRRRNRLTQEEFGRFLDVSKSSIINYESGYRSPDAIFLSNLVEQFEVDASWLLLGHDSFNDLKIKNETDNSKVQRLIQCLSIPTIRVLLIAEYERLRIIFKDQIERFENDKIEQSQFDSTQNHNKIS